MSLGELEGQGLAKLVVKNVWKNPEASPRSFIFEGEYGTGKTSLARIITRGLNCRNKNSNGLPCGECDVCTSDLKNVPYYIELDASMSASVDQIRDMSEYFSIPLKNYYRVVVFDEAHVMSRAAQNALLKEIEDVKYPIFYIFCTTEVENIIRTIRSRSLEIHFDKLTREQILSSLRTSSIKLGVELDEHVESLILERSQGHMRDAHKLLSLYAMVGKENFMKLYIKTDRLWFQFIYSLVHNDRDRLFKVIEYLSKFPLYVLYSDYLAYVERFLKRYVKDDLTKEEKDVILKLGKNTLSFFQMLLSNFILDSFDNDYKLRCALLVCFQKLGGSL